MDETGLNELASQIQELIPPVSEEAIAYMEGTRSLVDWLTRYAVMKVVLDRTYADTLKLSPNIALAIPMIVKAVEEVVDEALVSATIDVSGDKQ